MSAEMEPPAEKRQRSDKPAASQAPAVSINPWYLTPDFILPFRAAFTSALTSTYTHTSPDSSSCGTILSHPFHTAKLQNILPPDFLHSLKQELLTLPWHERSNDLYTFHQTDDLALNPLPHIKALRDYLASDQFVTLMETLTGTELARGHLDIAAQRYKKGGHLLCHDDDVQRGKWARRIAYIIYLVDEQWAEEDGGALGLYTNDDAGQPNEVVARLTPEFNSLGFFLTGLVSFHTVEEITVKDPRRERWSVTGWFYGASEPLATEDRPLSPSLLPALQPFDDHAMECAKWVSPDYLSPKTQDQIQDMFLDQSSVQLRQFLLPDVYAQIIAEADSPSTLLGPPHLRRYLELVPPPTSTLAALLAFLRSSTFAQLLTALTSIDTVAASQQLRRFEHGHYTLIHDQVQEPFGLDVSLSLQPTDLEWDDAWGGATHYIADKDELLRIAPEANSLSLVLRDEGTLRFVKFLNHMAPVSRQEVAMVFDIAPSESEDEDDE
ncbi:putative component of NuA3 histone acetyltransferase complex [Coemansia pectinata]|uniref:Component of NuA3 histone acetyltransferase complex n=1 Tax=Coemansia pectinata TaxID=1052879 RepID=A0A9W8H1Q3_9FUNG|nr:putative component of NuA3 histone acetyltransferase complex [Coemansia pectinata]